MVDLAVFWRHARIATTVVLLACVLVVLLATRNMQAQELPGAVGPGRIERQLEEPPPAPEALPPIVIPDVGRPVPPPGAETTRFVLNDIALEGNTAFSTDELRATWSNLLGREVTLAEVFAVAAEITILYRNAGYVLSRAVVPPQEIDNGIVEMLVVEGYIENVVIEGDPKGAAYQISHKTDAILASRPLRAEVLERYMLLLNDLPSVRAQSILRPSPTQSGASELIIVFEQTPFAASITADNYGTRFLGPEQFGLNIVANNVLGLFESTELRTVLTRETEELKFLSLSHTQLLTSEGTSLSLGASIVRTEPGSTLEPLDVEGRSESLTAFLTHPFIRTRSENLSGALGFRYLDEETRILDQRASRDKVRSIAGGGTYDFVDRFRGINLLGVELRQGLDIFGATESGSPGLTRQNGRSDFTKVSASVQRQQAIAPRLSAFVAATGQYAFSQLLASEEFGFGGQVFGRGYDPFEISGDHGVAAKAELQWGGASEHEWLDSYQVFAFYDVGAVWHIDSTNQDARESAASIGIGVRANFAHNFQGTALVGLPLTRPATTDRDDGEKRPRLFVRLVKRF